MPEDRRHHRRRANLVGELTERIRSFIADGSQVEG